MTISFISRNCSDRFFELCQKISSKNDLSESLDLKESCYNSYIVIFTDTHIKLFITLKQFASQQRNTDQDLVELDRV